MNILIIFVSYLLGSLPTGFLIGKYLKNIDLRTIGSGSTGATNVLRNIGKWPALFVFIIDVGKGLISVKIAQYYTDQGLIEVIAGISAISGHIWPIWLRGKGGKAVATGAKNIPNPVATAFPPLPLSHIGQICPEIADIPAMTSIKP